MNTALVVEDSRVQRESICRILRALDWAVLEAENGKHAMDMVLEHEGIDLIALDWHMPVMDGIEFLSEFRSMPEFSFSPKVIMLSVERTMSAIVQAISAGADEYVMKPFSIEILVNKLKTLGFYCDLPELPSVEEKIFSATLVNDRVGVK